ncbi:hypothetical protein G7046_g7530 [Stylonectria norvegica]|nr:hypothetical protein G7046_g7530 [Stylonectria norvegica]
MDLLLSLPIASYLLSPGLTSWSTSLNLLFFYMTWTTLILSHSPLKVRLIGTLAIRLVLWLLPSLLTLTFDLVVPSVVESIKLGGPSSLPPRDAARLGRVLRLALFNLALVTGAEAALSLAFTYVFQEPEFKTASALPLPWQMAKHVLVLLTARETLVYYIHRFVLHGDNAVAAQHRSYAHASASSPFSLQLFADHPLALLLHRFVPIYLPALLLRPHLLTYFLFVALCTAEETLAMSGYSIVPGIIMGGIVRRSAVHYAGRGASNYGAWGLLDWVHGTSRGGDVMDDVKAEADKHRVKQRSAKKANEGMGFIQDGVDALRNGSGLRRSPRKKSTRTTA